MNNLDKTSSMAEIPIPIEGETIEEFPNGVEISKLTNDGETEYLVLAPSQGDSNRGNAIPIPSFDELDFAKLYVDVYFATGGFDARKVGEFGVPPRVAADGTQALVAYLLCQGNVSRDWIENELDVRQGTIYSYLSRIRSRAQEAREEIEEGYD
jgi:hypothetical protein